MSSRIELVFPTYLYSGKFPNAGRFNRELAREIVALEKVDGPGLIWSRDSYVGGYSSYASECKLHLTSPNFAELEKRLRPHMQKFVRKLNWNLVDRKIRMTTCWVNSMGFAAHHTLHVHPGCALSGVYYVNVPPHSSPFLIEDPRMAQMMSSPPRKHSAPSREQSFITVTPKSGDFMLFESWMRHEVPPHRSKQRRVSVSFNYEWI